MKEGNRGQPIRSDNLPSSQRCPSPMTGAHPARYATTSAQAGRSRVWCGGLCMTGPDYRGTVLTLIIAVLLFAAQCSVSFPWLVNERTSIAIPLIIVMVISFSITVTAAYLASTTDPGIIPRSNDEPSSVTAFPAVRERVVNYRGRPITLKYCETCRIWRPPRSSHCATCNNCVRRFDHHCPWLGNDIGLRNYRSYFCFVVFASISAAVAITTSVLTLHSTTAHFRNSHPLESYGQSIRRALATNGTAVNMLIVLLCLLSFLFTGGLTGFHVYLMSQNVTTAESFKKRARNSSSPKDELRGCSAMFMLQGSFRQPSAVTEHRLGPAYPEETDFLNLIEAQVAEERDAQASVMPPPRVCAVQIQSP